jgi:uncharacterized protein
MKRAEIIKKLRQHSSQLSDTYGVKALYLFGSVARDEGHDQSDVDLFVELTDPISLFKFITLQHELERILGCSVDLGTKRSLKREIHELIEAETIRVA